LWIRHSKYGWKLGFNIAYLIIIWCFIAAMFRRWSNVDPKDKDMALAVLLAFIFLAVGDMGHVGFRVIAFSMGGLDATLNLFGNPVKLAPLGSIATAWTFTLFYVCMVFMWKARFKKDLALSPGLFFLWQLSALLLCCFRITPGTVKIYRNRFIRSGTYRLL